MTDPTMFRVNPVMTTSCFLVENFHAYGIMHANTNFIIARVSQICKRFFEKVFVNFFTMGIERYRDGKTLGKRGYTEGTV